MDPSFCTHLIYTFIGLNSDGTIRILDSYNDLDLGGYKRFNALKEKNHQLKTLIAIGGWNEGSTIYSQVAADPHLRKVFADDAVRFIKTYGFDGFDLDWEYPGQRGGSPDDKVNHVKLLKTFRAAFKEHGFLLTAAVAAAPFSVDKSYDVPAVARELDFINVMTYDLHGPWETVTGINAPLYPSSTETTEHARSLNVAACIKGWLERGAPPEKLILGVGSYGRTFTLANSSNSGVGATAYSPGQPGPYTGESGMMGYNEICEAQLKNPKWNVVWNEEQQVPYMHLNNQWVGYDDARSVALKVEFAKNQKLGGIMLWSIETDDFLGVCGPRYYILWTINVGLNKNISTQIPASTTTTMATTTISTFDCSEEGYFRDPIDCSKFYYCQKIKDNFIKSSFQCASNLVFDDINHVCNYKHLVEC